MSLHRQVLRALRDHALVTSGDRVTLALSGGADSVALVWLLYEIDSAGEWPADLVGLVHVNHGLRGDESARDEAFCRALAHRLSLPIEVSHPDIPAEARAARQSIEAAGRAARYRFFAEAAARLDATVVATAHTLDDQAETVLLRLLRGAGARGLSGIRRRRGAIIRPLLDCRRAELRVFLTERGESFCEDSSNRDIAFARNRVRQQLLPVIEDIAPGSIAALARFAALAADDEAYLERAAAESVPSVVLSDRDGVQLDAGLLVSLPRALGRRVARLAAETAAPGQAFGAAHLEALLGMAGSNRPGGHLDLPGLQVVRRGPTLYLGRLPGHGVAFEHPLSIPGCVEVPEAGLTMTAELASGIQDLTPMTAFLQDVSAPLTVRSRRPGDRLKPLGAPGHRKLQDVLVDRKVPRDERDRVPVVVDAAGRIVWVVGHVIAEACRVTTPETGVVVLKARRKN